MILEFVNKSPNENPSFSDKGSSGFDLRAWITEETEGFLNENKKYAYILKPFERKMIHTGLYFNVPEGLTVINTPGTIDESYTGECCVLIVNISNENIMIENGDRIAQVVFSKYCVANFSLTDKIDETDRGAGGFGHTGIK